jgi:lipid-A-disaccharide synthase
VRIFVSTADASGDLHAAALVEELRGRLVARGQDPDKALEVYGLGGKALAAAGLAPVIEQSELAVAGLVEVLGSLPRVVSAYRSLRAALIERRPDVAVLVDSPDLNIPLAAVAKRAGIPVFYYVAPQVWAWRQGRVRKLRRRVDRMAVIFPFEEEMLRRHGVPATFVGHPLVERMERVRRELKPDEAARELGIDRERPLLGLLPGSRRNEIARNLPVMLETAQLLRGPFPELQVRLLLAPTLEPPRDLPDFAAVIRGRTHDAMALASVLLAAPGTVTVEAALLRTPFLVTHQLNALTFEIVRRLSHVPSSCMVNLIAEQGVVSERLQEHARPAALAAEVSGLLRDPARAAALRASLAGVAAKLGGPGAARRAAELLLEVSRT